MINRMRFFQGKADNAGGIPPAKMSLSEYGDW
jgi:hypothetical protein